jgi:hypothetical protein
MVDVLRIKRRAAGGAAGPPSSLAAAEIAFNEQDNTLYYGKGNSGGLATAIVPIGGTGAPVVIVSDAAPASPSVGQLWFDSINAQLYVWYNDGTSSQWTIVTAVNVPQPSNLTPLMDNVAVVGSSTLFSRADHVHPTDTSRYAASNPSGYVNAAGAAVAAPVQSVATRTGAVTLNHTDILDWTASLAAPVPIGSTTPNTGAFTTFSTSGLATLASGKMNGGLSFGTATVTNPYDTSRHISLFDGWGGFSVTSGNINVVAAGQPQVYFNGTQMGMYTGISLLLSHDPPTVGNEAATKNYVDGTITRAGGPFLPLAGGTVSGGFVTIGTDTAAYGLLLNGPAGSYRRMEFWTASKLRWRLYTDFVAEGGANAGSDFRIDRYADDGSTFLGNAFLIARSTGGVILGGNLTFGGGPVSSAQDLSKQINLYGSNSYGFNVTNDGAVNYNTAGFHRFWSGSTSLVTITSTAITFSVPVTVNGTTQLSGLNFGNVAVASPQDQSKHINLYGSNQYGFSVSTDSAVNYNSVVKHNFWIGSTSILTIGNSAITANWPVTVNGALTVSNGMFSCFVNSQVIPASGGGLSVLWNFSGGQGEVNFFNTYTSAGGTRVFTWNQVTGTGTQRQLAALGPTSLTLNATNGIAYAGVTGGGNSIGFNWNAATSDVTLWVDGSNAGNLATKTFLGSNYLPLTGGTVTGATTFSAAGNALTVTNSAVINGFLNVGANTQSGTQIAVNGAAASSPGFSIRYAGSARWFIAADAFAETGGTTGNGGAGLAFYTYNNDGSFHGTALSITRDTYTTTFNGPLAATTFSGIATHNTGINFGSATSGGPTDLSRHIALYSNGYGFSITGGRLNYVSGGVHVFNIAGADVGTFTSTGMNATAIGATTPFTGAFTTLSASGVVSGAGFTTLLSPYAPLASPALTGAPTAPTATANTNTTQLATTQFANNILNMAQINVGGGVDYTLTVTQVGVQLLYLYGTLTANINVIFPAATTAIKTWQVMNLTSGAFTLTLTGVGGGTILLRQGARQQVWTDTSGIYSCNTDTIAPGAADNSTAIPNTAWVRGLLATPPAIGNITPSTGAFTTLSASGTVSGAGFTALHASPGPIGNTAASTGAFTTLSATGAVSGAGFTTLLASPPAIGGTASAAGSFTALSASSGLSFGSLVAGSTVDLSKHIALYPTYGFNVTGSRLNYTASSGAGHYFNVAGTDYFSVAAAGVSVFGNTPINMGGTNSILWGTQVALGYTGGDGNSTSVNNLRLASWNGIGFQNVGVGGQVVPIGLYGAYVGARNGYMVAARLFVTETLGATQLQNLRVTTSGTDQVLDITSGWAGYATLASTTPVAGGTGWVVNDRAYDAYNNFYTVMAVTAGAVTTIRLDTRASYPLAAPTNPITLTAAPGFVGTGLTVNLTWNASTRIVLQHSTGGLLLSSLNGTQVTGGMNFGSTSGAGPSDLSNHIALFSNTYGIGVSGLRMNHVVPQTSSNVMVCGTTDVLTINQNTVLSSVGIAAPIKSVTGTSYSALAADSTLLMAPSGTFTLSLLNPVNWTGRFLHLKLTTAFAVNSASANVVPLVGGAATTAIMPATAGKFCLLQSDGTNWQIMEAN